MAKNHDFSDVVARYGATWFFPGNPAVSPFLECYPLTLCKNLELFNDRKYDFFRTDTHTHYFLGCGLNWSWELQRATARLSTSEQATHNRLQATWSTSFYRSNSSFWWSVVQLKFLHSWSGSTMQVLSTREHHLALASYATSDQLHAFFSFFEFGDKNWIWRRTKNYAKKIFLG